MTFEFGVLRIWLRLVGKKERKIALKGGQVNVSCGCQRRICWRRLRTQEEVKWEESGNLWRVTLASSSGFSPVGERRWSREMRRHWRCYGCVCIYKKEEAKAGEEEEERAWNIYKIRRLLLYTSTVYNAARSHLKGARWAKLGESQQQLPRR